MKKKNILLILFFVFLAIGIVFTFFRETKVYSFFFVLIVQPIIALYYISIFKKEETEKNRTLILRYPLLILLQSTFIVLLIKYLFMAMHWPGAVIVKLLLFVFSIVTVLFAIGFVVVNRKIIQSIFVVEFVLMVLPILLFLGMYAPTDFSRAEHLVALNHQYDDLEQIKTTLSKQVAKDTSIDLSKIRTLEEIKTNTIRNNGGINEDGEIIGSLEKMGEEENRFLVRKLQNDSLTAIINQRPVVVIEYLSRLTKLQIDLLLKEKQ